MARRDGELIDLCREEPQLGRAFFEYLALRIEEAKAANRIEGQLPPEDLAGLILVASADGRPNDAGETRFLYLVFAYHGSDSRWAALVDCRRPPLGFDSEELAAGCVGENAKGVP
jgi:hypothetical protein